MAYLPVDLGYAVVYPAVGGPEEDVGVEVVIALEAACVAAALPCAFVAIDSEGGYAEFDPWLGLADCLVDVAYEHADVVSSPLVFVCVAAAVACEACLVGEFFSWGGVGVEVVVHVEAVDVVATDYVVDDGADVVAVFGQGGVIEDLSAVPEKVFGVLDVGMRRGQG